jgi:tRNA dimethylallyltransferase
MANLPDADIKIRAMLDEQVKTHGLAFLHQRLTDIDPVSAARINPNDPQRIQRALEVYELTGKSMTELTESQAEHDFRYDVIKIILSPFERSTLHKRIEKRYKAMVDNGFVDEVRTLFEREDCHPNLPSIRAVGYRQAWSYLAGDYDKATFIEKAIIATRQMAKRQLTWLRSQQDGVWFDSGEGLPTKEVVDFLTDNYPDLMIK